jgi:DNA polymerase III epsilon subunit-like protein
MHFAVDTETNSLNDPYPIEISAVKIDDFSVFFCERIRTDSKIDSRAQEVHGISSMSLIHCRNEADVMKSFINFLSQHAKESEIVLVAHNAKFDKLVILNALKRCNMSLPNNVTWECTREMSRQKQNRNNKLSDCCLRAGIMYKDAHCALPDAIMCARVFKDFFKPSAKWLEYEEGLAQVNASEAEEATEREEYRKINFF